MKNRYACPTCAGRGAEECPECVQLHDCKACQGSGLDSDRVDVFAYNAAMRAMLFAGLRTWAWVEDDELIGRKGDFDSVQIVDFLKEK